MKSEAPAGTGATHNGRKEHIAGDRQFEVVSPSGKLKEETAGLLEAIAAFVSSYVVLSDAQISAIALWTLHTHAFDASECTPYISVTSAEKASGKTRLLEALELVVANAWLTGRVTPAVLARKVHAERPTLLLDETDATFAGDPEFGQVLRGLLNSGYDAVVNRPSVSVRAPTSAMSTWTPSRRRRWRGLESSPTRLLLVPFGSPSSAKRRMRPSSASEGARQSRAANPSDNGRPIGASAS
jgi:hypothetical protein